MENSDQNVSAENAAQQQPTVDEQKQAPLTTYESVNSDAQVVTADVISERLKNAKPAAAPLGAYRDANRRKREAEKAEGDEKGEKKERRPRRDRKEQNGPKIVVPKKPHTNAVLANRREGLGDLADDFEAILAADGDFEAAMMTSADKVASVEQLEMGDKVSFKITSISKESVFGDIGAAEQGCIPLKQFPDDMVLEIGQTFDAVVAKMNTEDGYYEISLPLAAAEVGDWLSLTKGAIVEATVTAANKGGLEVLVGKLRGFMPSSQIAPFFVENAESFVGERWKCIVTEVNAERRNLVVSRRALMQKERDELKEKTMSELQEGQTREGTVRKVIEIGAFVDLGGVDGFIHISQLGWGRVKNVTDAVKEGDKVTVTVTKIDTNKNRISLSLRDSAKDPWNTVDTECREGDVVRGTVSKVLDFGAFVELPNGLEGLVHISEIAYQRVDKVSDVLTEGDVVDVKILSVDTGKKKISLSIKKTQEDPRIKAREEAQAKADAEAAAAEAEAKKKDEDALAAARERIRKMQSKKPLKGGLTRNDDGDKFGLHF